MKYDTIAVLARGIHPDGTLYPDSALRVEHSVKLYQEGVSDLIILSGKWSIHDKRDFVQTEAAAMRIYAQELGVPIENILCETESITTVENILNIKELCQNTKLRSVLLICGKDHRARVQYIAKKVFGDDIAFDISISKREKSLYEVFVRPIREYIALSRLRSALKHVSCGDDTTIRKIVQTYIDSKF